MPSIFNLFFSCYLFFNLLALRPDWFRCECLRPKIFLNKKIEFAVLSVDGGAEMQKGYTPSVPKYLHRLTFTEHI
jgi:hypothetical protein